MNLHEKLKTLPEEAGVYIMKDSGGNIIYIGKSKCLKNRVRSYFTKNSSHTPKVTSMVQAIYDFEYIITDTEWEALVLECNLIKKHKPYYNILLKDSKQYPYIRLTAEEPYPRLMLSRKVEKNGSKYFGPYSGGIVRDTLDTLRKTFKIRTCTRVFPRDIGKSRPCLNYHIGLCMAPCSGKISQEEYHCVTEEIMDFLEGRETALTDRLTEKMYALSDSMRFEAAADIRDKINHLKAIAEKQKITDTGGKDRDIVAIVAGPRIANAQVFSFRGGKLQGREELWIEGVSYENEAQIASNFLAQFYYSCEYIPKEIFINILPDDSENIERWLSQRHGSKVALRVPERGTGRETMEMAVKNGLKAVKDYHESANGDRTRNTAAAQELAAAIGVNNINRIEAYDISTTAGENSVGSMAVFQNGELDKSEYRHFKIKTVSGVNDYGSLNEVLMRRFNRWKNDDGSFAHLPDLILADGGVAQAGVIAAVVKDVGVSLPVYGMVKDAHHKTRALISTDGEVIPLSDEAFRLVAMIQEEVHRIAIGYHRKLRGKALVHSVLEDIPGIGPKRRGSLIKHFKSIKAVESATVDQLMEVDGINKSAAEAIYRHFRK
ncbi:MAG: excinuclease ABC subunit UvrC [Bacillota bacterium]|nr:excinuclease ABC subunit UvrC [Bacillota bacterium]